MGSSNGVDGGVLAEITYEPHEMITHALKGGHNNAQPWLTILRAEWLTLRLSYTQMRLSPSWTTHELGFPALSYL